jgi:hypothetical protein
MLAQGRAGQGRAGQRHVHLEAAYVRVVRVDDIVIAPLALHGPRRSVTFSRLMRYRSRRAGKIHAWENHGAGGQRRRREGSGEVIKRGKRRDGAG